MENVLLSSAAATFLKQGNPKEAYTMKT